MTNPPEGWENNEVLSITAWAFLGLHELLQPVLQDVTLVLAILVSITTLLINYPKYKAAVKKFCTKKFVEKNKKNNDSNLS